jgi:hypothetical protein
LASRIFGDQVFDNLQMHVGFEQRQADLAHHRAEVLFADPSLARMRPTIADSFPVIRLIQP